MGIQEVFAYYKRVRSQYNAVRKNVRRLSKKLGLGFSQLDQNTRLLRRFNQLKDLKRKALEIISRVVRKKLGHQAGVAKPAIEEPQAKTVAPRTPDPQLEAVVQVTPQPKAEEKHDPEAVRLSLVNAIFKPDHEISTPDHLELISRYIRDYPEFIDQSTNHALAGLCKTHFIKLGKAAKANHLSMKVRAVDPYFGPLIALTKSLRARLSVLLAESAGTSEVELPSSSQQTVETPQPVAEEVQDPEKVRLSLERAVFVETADEIQGPDHLELISRYIQDYPERIDEQTNHILSDMCKTHFIKLSRTAKMNKLSAKAMAVDPYYGPLLTLTKTLRARLTVLLAQPVGHEKKAGL
jgi:hypothetical protein